VENAAIESLDLNASEAGRLNTSEADPGCPLPDAEGRENP
jgi:hypothetical protein